MGTTSVCSCERFPNVLYAACASADGRLNVVLRSVDGGYEWTMCDMHVEGDSNPLRILPLFTGEQGAEWNNCIAAAPSDPSIVALGWVKGPFISLDAGKNWQEVTERAHLHDDIHSLRFTPTTSVNDYNLYVCSDGGVSRIDLTNFVTIGLTGQRYQSDYNRFLPTLQCYGTYIENRQVLGTFTGSTDQPGLILAGTQDNGNLYCQTVPTQTPWVHLDGGDGGWNAFLDDGSVLHNIKGYAVGAGHAGSGPKITDLGVVPIGLPPANANGLNGVFLDAVRRPSYKKQGRPLFAIGGIKNEVYGCYSDANIWQTYHWDLIATLPAGVIISAVGSYNGETVHVGTADGRMFVVDTSLSSAVEVVVNLPKPYPNARVQGGQITRIAALPKPLAFAVMNGATATSGAGVALTLTTYYILRLDNSQWNVTQGLGLPNEPFFGLEVVSEPQIELPRGVFVSTDDRVFVSRNDGYTWQRAALGLPRNPHCGDLRWVSTNRGSWLYLATYGRSVHWVQFR
jgi:hypothetical protein